MTDDATWQPIAGASYVGTRPNRRWPLYTRGNVGEVYPEVVYPLTVSSTLARISAAWAAAVCAGGFFTPDEFEGQPSAAFGVFGGYTYLNLSMARVLALRTPGARTEDIDEQLFGRAPTPPLRRGPGDRSLRRTVAVAVGLTRTLRGQHLDRLAVDARRVAAWQRALPPLAGTDTATLRRTLDDALELAAELFEHHIFVTNQSAIAGTVVKLCRDRLGDEGLGLRLLAGLGDVESAAPSWALWDLGRAAGEPAVAAQFDQGVAGLWERLQADEGAEAFVAEFRRFLARHGSRGPNEWEPACHSWATRPELALALVDRMRLARADQDPRLRHRRTAEERAAARAELQRRAPWPLRRLLERLIELSGRYLQGREQAKTTVVALIHQGRLILRELGRRSRDAARAAGVADAEIEDIWFVVVDELDGFLADPAAFAPRIAERRATRRRLAERVPPFVFEGEPPPWDSWPLRRDTGALTAPAPGDVLHGIAGSPGVARGRARVVLDAGEPGELAAGEILVAPITDPAWTPLFVPCAAVVVDVGALLSHAVIVARELGIPAVVSVTDATRLLRDGDLVEVDGNRGTVTVLSSAAPGPG